MKRFEDLPESLLERGIPEAKADPAQSNVREDGVGLHVVGQHRTDHESGCRRWFTAKRDTTTDQFLPLDD